MNRQILYLTVSLLVALLMGCHASSSKGINQSGENELITSDNMNRIAGMQWILHEMTVDGQDFHLTGEKPFIKIGSDGKVSGFGSVNRYFGSVQIDEEGNLKWSPLGSTRMAGPEEMMKQEDIYFKALPTTHNMSIDRIYLYLSTEDKQTELVFYVPVE